VTAHLTSDHLPWVAWRAAASDPVIDRALGDLYDRLDADVAKRGPTCWVSGRCCRFDEYDHRLYVTGLEVVWVLARVASQKSQVTSQGALPGSALDMETSSLKRPPAADGACVFQEGGLCGIRDIRPMGCRVFFCQQGTEDWQRELYERHLGDLRALHDAHDVPYRYLEWRSALEAAGR